MCGLHYTSVGQRCLRERRTDLGDLDSDSLAAFISHRTLGSFFRLSALGSLGTNSFCKYLELLLYSKISGK